MSVTRIVLLGAAGFILLLIFVPGVRNKVTQTFTAISSRSETITVPASPGLNSASLGSDDEERSASVGENLELITLLGFDAIPAILDPKFIDADEADAQMRPDELVLGLDINGESKAYSIPMLSAHEIVNDVVGGVPLAVTW